jgi:hypothetical protein
MQKKIHTACERERGSGEIHGKGEGKARSVSRRSSQPFLPPPSLSYHLLELKLTKDFSRIAQPLFYHLLELNLIEDFSGVNIFT